ncbi:phosphoenolpyruvate--protein phosphotransferase [Desulfobacterota bacterium AH_259_B03_O07]|nr:phosphoenolpyruvate--protein phosphotransferase [Desulfobacterota bacterium AH_259_B03_O07]
MRFELKGIAISHGVSLGKVALLDRTKAIVERTKVDPSTVQSEKERFLGAVQKSKEHLHSIIDRFDPMEKGEHLQILNFNIMMLEDDLFCEEVIRTIESEKVNAEWAITYVLSLKTEEFRFVEDIYMKERLADIYHLGETILRNLRGLKDDIADLEDDSVLVAHDISPVDVVSFSKHRAIGLATDVGAATSHSAIIARSLGIPTVMGLEDISLKVSPGDSIFVDGYNGVVIVNFTEKEVTEFIERRKNYDSLGKKLKRYAKLPGKTQDEVAIKVNANIEIADEIDLALSYGAEGIGMYRTEFLFTRSEYFPTEREQFEDYKNVISVFKSPNITIRTLDIGGDKFPPGMEPPKELNPALGLRGIRFSLMDANIFRTQIRAILKASCFGKMRILIPMVSSLFEVIDTKKIIQEVSGEIDCSPSWEIGVMIETPSAAILTSEIAEEVDFLSIGTNDLIQYTLAVDRVNEHVSYLFSHFHPAVLRLLKNITEVATRKGVPVSVCGEMAGQLSCVPLLVGMGVDELSMNTHSIPMVKKLLNSITKAESEEILGNALKLKTTADTKKYVINAIIDKWGKALPLECVQEILTDQAT